MNSSDDHIFEDTKEWKDTFDKVFSQEDESEDWTLVKTPAPIFGWILIYTFFALYVFPKWRNGRRPIHLRNCFRMYNLIHIMGNFYLFFNSLMVMNSSGFLLKCAGKLLPSHGSKMLNLTWLFVLTKCFQFFQTGFRILANEPEDMVQILQHTMRPVNAWICLKFHAGQPTAMVVLLNSLADLLLSLLPMASKFGRSTSFLRKATAVVSIVEILQFNVISAHALVLFFADCQYSQIFLAWILLYSLGTLCIMYKRVGPLEKSCIVCFTIATPFISLLLAPKLTQAL